MKIHKDVTNIITKYAHKDFLFKMFCFNSVFEPRTICDCQAFGFLYKTTKFFELLENLIQYCEAYLPGAGDTVIMKAVLPGRGLSIALRLG